MLSWPKKRSGSGDAAVDVELAPLNAVTTSSGGSVIAAAATAAFVQRRAAARPVGGGDSDDDREDGGGGGTGGGGSGGGDGATQPGSGKASMPGATSAVPLASQRLSTFRMVALAAFWFGVSAWTYVLLVLFVPRRVQDFSTAHNRGSVLGLTLLAGAVTATICSPVVGALSDRCRTRIGRRRPFLLAGVLASSACGVALHYANSLPAFIVAVGASQLTMAVAVSPFNGLVSDVVQPQQRGVASGFIGGCVAGGNMAGAAIGSQITNLGSANTLIAIYSLVCAATLVTVVFVKEPTPPSSAAVASGGVLASPPRRRRKCRSPITAGPFARHDFRWLFLSRAIIQMGVFTVQNFLYLWLDDSIALPDGLAPEAALSFVMLPLLVAACLAPMCAGCISDRLGGRRKLIALAGGFVMVAGAVSLAWTRSWDKLPLLGAVFGVGYGVFNALDYAIALEVCSLADAAHDLGVWNLSLAVPMCLASPAAGLVLDSVNDNTDGFKVLFLMAAGYFAVGSLGLLKLRGVK